MSASDAGQAWCPNEEHEQDVPAVYDVSFPNGDWNGTLACAECLSIIVDNMLDSPTMVLFQPVTAAARSQTCCQDARDADPWTTWVWHDHPSSSRDQT